VARLRRGLQRPGQAPRRAARARPRRSSTSSAPGRPAPPTRSRW
jgi:hypothetical protein